MGIVDAYFGRLFSKGVELELRGGINASTGLKVVADAANERNDLSVDFMRVLALGNLELDTGATIDLTGSFADMSATYAAGAWNMSSWTASTSIAGMTWAGTEAAYVLALASVTVDPAAVNKKFAFRWAIDGTDVNEPVHMTPSVLNDASCTAVGLLYVEPGEVVSLMAANHTDTTDFDLTHLQMVLVALGVAG